MEDEEADAAEWGRGERERGETFHICVAVLNMFAKFSMKRFVPSKPHCF